MSSVGSLPLAQFGFPGTLRDQLTGAILGGTKTSTTGLVEDYLHEREPLPTVGSRSILVDSLDQPLAILEVTDVRVVHLKDVDLAHALDEGEGFATLAEWRSAHERFWHGPEMRAALEDPSFTVKDETLVVLERFRVLPSDGA